MAFVKVVEGQLIYNFAIQHLAYFCFKIWRKPRSKDASLNDFWPLASRVCRRAKPRACPPHSPLGPHAEAVLGPPVCAPWDPLVPHRLPPPLPLRHAPRALWPWAARCGHTRRPCRRPATGEAAVPYAHVAVVPRPCCDLAVVIDSRTASPPRLRV
jgi:hypothetical protein